MVGKMFWRTALKCWYVKVDGRMHRLVPDEAEAKRRRDALLVEHGTRKPTVDDIVTLYLDWGQSELAETTYERRERPLRLLAEQFGSTGADSLEPADLKKWLSQHYPNANPTTRGGMLSVVSIAWNWAERNHKVRSQVKHLDKPTPEQRVFYLLCERWPELLSHCHPEVYDLVNFMLLTGARPQEARILQKRHWHGNRFVLEPWESKGRRVGRVIYVPDPLVDRINELVDRPYVLMTSKGQPWCKNSYNIASRRLKRKIGENKFCMYTCRHSFAADKVRKGVDIAFVAKLLGHTSTDMVYKRYGHLAQQDERLLLAVNA